MAKWNLLTEYLKGVEEQVTLTWPDLAAIVGEMPASATKHRPWWGSGHPHVRSWTSAGFDFADLQMGLQVTFYRVGSQNPMVKTRSHTASENPNPAIIEHLASQPSLDIGGHRFALGSAIDVRRNEEGAPLLSFPSKRYDNFRKLKLNKYGEGPFVSLRLAQLPAAQGVYAVVAGSGEVLYIGQSADTIRTRWQMGYATIQPRNCYEGGQSTNCRINNLIYRALNDGREIELYVTVTVDYDAIERELIARLQPAWNVQGIR